MTRDDVRRFMANPALLLGLAGVLALTIVALFGPHLASADPNAQRIVIFFPDGRFLIPPTPPDQYYPLGTDPLGRDQLARVLYGARLTFTVALLALLIRAALAIALGILAGWRGGLADRAVVLVTNAASGIPQLLLALLLAVWLRDRAILGFVIALGLVGWAEGAQFIRGEVQRIRGQPYVDAARALGGRTRGVLTRHVLRGLGPQLFGLLSLEAGSTLLLLAELGFLGVFMSGGAFLVDANNRPILPARDRAPEWGQMLAGAQQYAFHDQYVAFVPGVIVGVAVFVFNLLGEGVRAATDPFSTLSLSPRALGSLGRGVLAVALVSAAFFGVSEARSTTLSFDDALGLARQSAAKMEPDAPLIAAVVRLESGTHGIERPDIINFYFRSKGVTPMIRVGFPNADQNAMEVKRDDQDGIVYDALTPLAGWRTDWRDALAKAEDNGGRTYRTGARAWEVRLVLSSDFAIGYPIYRVAYGAPTSSGAPSVSVLVDARTGDANTPALRFAAARLSAEALLGGDVALAVASAVWAPSTPGGGGLGPLSPASVDYSFVRADAPNDRRLATVSFRGGSPSVNLGTTSLPQQPLRPLSRSIDLDAAFSAVQSHGGADVMALWDRDGVRLWSISAIARMDGASLVVTVTYQRRDVSGTIDAVFSYDVSTGEVTRQR